MNSTITAPLKRLLASIKDGTHGTFTRVDEGLPLLSAKNVQHGHLLIGTDESLISEADHLAIVANGFPRRHDVLLTIVGTIGRSCVFDLDSPLAFQRSVAFLRPRPGVDPRYLAYLTQSAGFQDQLALATKSAAQGGVYMGDVWEAPCTYVIPREQERIANFLDEKTARIDALIAEKERLVEVLSNAAADLLHDAVTKGIDGAPLKESGRQWMGRIPSHWSAPFVRFVARLESGHTPSRQHPEYWENCTIPWFTLADVWQIRDGRREVVTETKELVSELVISNSSARLLPAGTVMLSRTASVGFSAIMGTPMATTQDFVNWVCGHKVLPEYLLYVFRSMRVEFERLKFGSTHSTIYMPDVAKLSMPLPPVPEQRKIVEAARTRKQKIDALIEAAKQSTSRLREYRSALISAAVTGQLNLLAES